MDDEFKLCWKNFQDNIASGFQNLYDRGDLVDVTLACDGKLLHAHKIVLAICSPYFQEIFITNPCKHPIIILKDVKFSIMCELLEFMYQGVVNVKHTELQGFMKIGQLLQVKGLATNSSTPSSTSQKSPSQNQSCNSTEIGGANSPANSCASNNLKNSQYNSSNIVENANNNVNASESGAATSGALKVNNNNNNSTSSNIIAQPSSSTSSASSSSPMPPSSTSSFAAAVAHIKNQPENTNPFQAGPSLKRLPEYSTEALSIYSRKQYRRSAATLAAAAAIENDHDVTNDSMDHVNPDDFFLPTIPHISMMESRYDLNNVKRESNEHTAAGLRNSLSSTFGFDYNIYKNNSTGIDYSSDSHMPNDYSKSFGNHMDIPSSGSNVTMLSSTSLLHANCVFNRNNTVATQQGMKTYWLCKSYRISMCRARCITHQGRVISATGVHNHPPHMRVPSVGGPDMLPPGSQANVSLQSSSASIGNSNSVGNLMPMQSSSGSSSLNSTIPNLRLPQGPTPAMLSQHSIGAINGAQQQNQSQQLHQHHSQQQQQQPPPPPPPPQLHQQHSNPSQSLSLHHHQLPPNVVHHPSIHQNNGAGPSSLHSHQQHSLHGSNHGPPAHSQSSVIQNMMHNVNLMHLSNIGPMLNPLPPPSSALAQQHSPQLTGSIVHHQQHSHQLHHQQHHPPSSLEITPILAHSPDITSPTNRNSQSHGTNINSPMATTTSSGGGAGGSGVPLESPSHTSDGNSSSVNMTADCNSTSVPNSAVSPSNVTGASSNCHSVSQDSHNSSQHSHIISSITISPSTAHNFKIEDM